MDFSSIKSIEELEYISKEVMWQNFERLTGFIFEQNGFNVQVSKVLTENKKKRRQYDVIATKGNLTYITDCKKWSGNRYRLSGIKTAIKKHKERTEFYNNFVRNEMSKSAENRGTAQSIENQKESNTKAIPIIVTLIEEEIQSYEAVHIIPILKLNSFLQEI